MSRSLRLVFAGTPEFAAVHLQALIDAGYPIAAVYTQPDRPAGRGQKLAMSPVKQLALAHGIPVEQPPTLRDPAAQATLAALEPDLLVVVAYGLILPQVVLDIPRLGCINSHASLLPRWRGAAPVERAIMAGDEETGVCIMRVAAGLDSGPVCLMGREPIRPDDTYGTLAPRLEALGAELLVRALDERPAFVEQDEEGATYAEKITAADRTLDPAAPAQERERVVRALQPHIGARLQLEDGSFLGVRRARAPETGTLELLEVQPAGGRVMSYAEYLRGRGGRAPAAES